MQRVVVLAATRRELAPVRAVLGFRQIEQERLGKFPHQVGHAGGLELHLINTGIGHERAREASESALFAVSPDGIISTGYAGGLDVAGLGELILGTGIRDWTSDRSDVEIQADCGFLEAAQVAAREATVTWRQGPVLTVQHIIWRASEKQALGRASGAIAVDMESAAIASVAVAAGIPFLVARAVSDSAADDLPMDFNRWLAPFGPARLLMEIIRRPSALTRLYAMKRQADRASETLRRFFCVLIRILGDRPSPTAPDLPATAGARS